MQTRVVDRNGQGGNKCFRLGFSQSNYFYLAVGGCPIAFRLDNHWLCGLAIVNAIDDEVQ